MASAARPWRARARLVLAGKDKNKTKHRFERVPRRFEGSGWDLGAYFKRQRRAQSESDLTAVGAAPEPELEPAPASPKASPSEGASDVACRGLSPIADSPPDSKEEAVLTDSSASSATSETSDHVSEVSTQRRSAVVVARSVLLAARVCCCVGLVFPHGTLTPAGAAPPAQPNTQKKKKKKKLKRSKSAAAIQVTQAETPVTDHTPAPPAGADPESLEAADPDTNPTTPNVCAPRGKTNHVVGDDDHKVRLFVNRVVHAEYLKVVFAAKRCELRYSTPDAGTWTWAVDLFDEVLTPECSFAVTAIGIELYLAKADLYKQWGHHIGEFHESHSCAEKASSTVVENDKKDSTYADLLPEFDAIKKHAGEKQVAALITNGSEGLEATLEDPSNQTGNSQPGTGTLSSRLTEKRPEGDVNMAVAASASAASGQPEAGQAIHPGDVRTDHYEKGADVVVATVYIKNIDKDSFESVFRPEGVTLRFKTENQKFMQWQDGIVDDAFAYSGAYALTIPLSHGIVPDKCTAKVMSTKVELCLKKQGDGAAWETLMPKPAAAATAGSDDERATTPTAAVVGPAPKLAGTSVDDVTKDIQALNVETQTGTAAKKKKKTPAPKAEMPAKPAVELTPLSTYTGNGGVGLNNLGNTCFMNCIFQCLSNIPSLRDLFLTGEYLQHINTDNHMGSGGKIAKAYAKLQQQIWSSTDAKAVAPLRVKAELGKLNEMYAGNGQQDAHELLTYLLDYLHEDLNAVKKRPYREIITDGVPDAKLAKDSWDYHVSRNESPVTPMFFGQIKSILTCSECNFTDTKFDATSCLTVPLPQKHRRFEVRFVPRNRNDPVRIVGVTVPIIGELKQITAEVAKVVNIPVKNLQLVVVKGPVFNSNNTKARLESIKPGQEILCFARMRNKLLIPVIQRWKQKTLSKTCDVCGNKPAKDKKLSVCSKCKQASYCSGDCQKADWKTHKKKCKIASQDAELHGRPFFIPVNDDMLQPTAEKILNLAKTYSTWLGDGVDCESASIALVKFSKTPLLVGKISPGGLLPMSVQRIPCIQLTWEGGVAGKNELDPTYTGLVQDASLAATKEAEDVQNAKKPSLKAALNLFEQVDTLDGDDKWYCSKCKTHREATKKMSIWKIPPVLMLHLKRFEYRNPIWKDKLDFMVDYPTTGLDMSPFVADADGEELIYDLTGVAHHHGLIWGGHYTADCKSPADGQWRNFNDSKASPTSAEQAMQKSAYVLFYRRRGYGGDGGGGDGGDGPAPAT